MSEEEKENKQEPQPDEQQANTETGSSPGPIPGTEQHSIINPQLSTEETMEVHHHTHPGHGKKTWKEYFWEFLMLFLAVFCGFLAEYKLEQTFEKHREKEFITSMIEDAITDTASIHTAIPLNLARINYADSLAVACFGYKGTPNDNLRLYQFQRKCIYYPDLVYPSDRTLFQLKNSGGMRLIRNKKAVEDIVAYDNSGKRLINQQAYYEMYLTNVAQSSARLMSFLNFIKFDNNLQKPEEAKLVNPNEEKLLEFGNNTIMFKGVLMQYVERLKEMKEEAVVLIHTLKKEYHLK
ncbi:MAG: DUF1820 family protein [Bacteroidetes bacterium]|nr:DUF1820 family protein [Bacteroidota bacterium]